jgi:hypothetical protein
VFSFTTTFNDVGENTGPALSMRRTANRTPADAPRPRNDETQHGHQRNTSQQFNTFMREKWGLQRPTATPKSRLACGREAMAAKREAAKGHPAAALREKELPAPAHTHLPLTMLREKTAAEHAWSRR